MHLGKDSIIKDACHRVLVNATISDFDHLEIVNQYQTLSTAYFLHLSVLIDDEDIVENDSLLLRRIQRLKVLKNGCQGDDVNKQKLFFSLQIKQPTIDTVKFLDRLDFKFDLWIINAKAEKEQLFENIIMIHKYFTSNHIEAGSQPYLGLGNVIQHDDLDWLLLTLPVNLVVVILLDGNTNYPNLQLRSVDLVHSFGCNSIITLSDTQLDCIRSSQQLLDLSAKYDVSPETFLMKCLLQFGCLIGLTLGGGGKSSHQDFFLNQVSRLCHPFVHRKLYVSATHVLSLQIDPADLDVVAAASEQSEALGDASWLCHAAAKSDVRILTFDSSG